MFYIPCGFSQAVSALIGAALGNNEVAKAQSIVRQVFILMGVTVLASVLFFQYNSVQLVRIYSISPELEALASSNLRTYSAIFILDAFNVTLNGVIKGLGLQQKAQKFAFISFFFISLPSAYIIAIRYEFGINGLWYGFAIGLLVINISYIFLIKSANWDTIVLDIQNTIETQLSNLEKS